ncbi:unnamed protein product [Closterium sp. Naga37s-1]|nr:unnamed protein product [Closterium sp. Naga37s-1]
MPFIQWSPICLPLLLLLLAAGSLDTRWATIRTATLADAKTVVVGRSRSGWDAKVRTWQPPMCALFPTPLNPPPPLSTPLPGRQDGGGGVESLPLEYEGAHVAALPCSQRRHCRVPVELLGVAAAPGCLVSRLKRFPPSLSPTQCSSGTTRDRCSAGLSFESSQKVPSLSFPNPVFQWNYSGSLQRRVVF